ncbi:MAG: 2-acyl-glycerophospho-ethanolamine acyltransferase [Gammaproteobacteria bacterium RIFCSPLOWO2_02_FULL_61_13]|nr:MAG: 2-acyl-glycerophospho-ethanolamine acyltransferase [Gammaproteobacteria bacterium RIFCSPLOWO2_02_FULL_61_13]
MTTILKIRGFMFFLGMGFLNAFVDLGHKIVIQNTVFKVYDGETQVILTAVVNALILLPFVLLFSPAGFLSDRFAKPRVMRAGAWAAVLLTILITVCYYQGWFWPAFAMTFLLAIQAALYSPAKYGYIKELVGTGHLAAANGIVQAVTTVAILAGVFVFSVLFEGYLEGAVPHDKDAILRQIAPVGYLLIIGSLIEVACAYALPPTPASSPDLAFNWQSYGRAQYLKNNIGIACRNEVIFLSIIGLSIFWAIAQVVLASFPAFAKETMGLTDSVTVQGMLACSGIGIVLGSTMAGRMSRAHIETGLVPIGAFGVTLSLALTPLLNSVTAHGLNFIALGFLGGLFIIPLNALIQYHAEEHERGRVLAGNNFIQNCLMLGFLGLAVAFSLLGLRARDLFLLLMVVALGGAIYTVYKLPQALARIIATLLLSQRYRIDVIGFHRLPQRGGVLLLGNHISWIDWAIVQIACPRPVRFVMYRGIYERWYLKWFLDFFGVIPISGGGSKSALEEVREHLMQGEIVCLFPEGTISRTGQLNEFKRGYETATTDVDGVIIPFYLRGLWGTVFSHASTRLRTLRGRGIRRDIVVAFGKPLPMQTPTDTLKRRVLDLSIEAWQRHADSLQTLPEAWLDTAKRATDDMVLADTLSGPLSGTRVIAGVLLFAGRVRRLCPEPNVGLLLPTSNGGTIANLAVLMCGKTVVNLNYTASREAITAAIAKARIGNVITSRRFLERLAKRGMDMEAVLSGVRIHSMEDLAAGMSKLRRMAALLQAVLFPAWLLRALHCRRVTLDHPAAILFSSGSEGEPKGVVLSHRNIMANLKQTSDVLNTETSDVVMATLPLFHAFGLTVTTLMPMIEGIPVVCHPDPTDAVGVAKAVATYEATLLCGTSTFLRLYARNNRVDPLMFESLRLVVAGAEKLAADVRESFKLKFQKEVYEGFGATETTPVASVNVPNRLDTSSWVVHVGTKPGTVGLPLPGTSFRIVDPDTLQELPTDSDGLILIGGAQVMLGYLDDPARTAAVIVELDGMRWYKTGDKGHLDEDGFLVIVDRYSRFAKIAGEMVSLTAVEEQTRGVLADPETELVAVNLPAEKKGEQIVMLIADPAVTPDIVRKALLDKGCNALTIPEQVYIVPEIPRLGSGKTDFTAARKLAVSLLAGHDLPA